MRKGLFLIGLSMLTAVLLTACKSDSDNGTAVSITSAANVEVYPTVNQKVEVTFTASADWRATANVNWLTVSPAEGKAGSRTITVTTTQTNRTKNQRSGVVTISAGSSQRTVTIRQRAEYAVFDKEVFDIGAEGGSLKLTFTSNIDDTNDLTIAYNSSLQWIRWAEAAKTRADWRGSTTELFVDANEGKDQRTAIYVLGLNTGGGSWVGLDTCYVRQAGASNGYQSTDFSADGRINIMQQATTGKGINIVMMGDGFADRDISDGTYDKVMKKAMDNLFSEEPVKSMRDYFNVYAVTAVSENDNVGEDYKTVFSTVPDPQTSGINADNDMVMRYVRKIEGIDSLNTLAVVILNSNVHKGVTYLYSNSRTGDPIQYAAAFCPVIENLESEEFRTVLVHEAIGHGLAKLGDEYGYKENGAPSDEEKVKIKQMHRHGWLKNVDTTNDVATVDWHLFIGSSHFSNEAIRAYEGGYTYTLGVYRPTEQSMMNSNHSPFNAPSRKAIYDRIRKLGEGRPEASFDEFAAFDNEHKPQQWNYASKSRAAAPLVEQRPARPVMLWRNW